MERENVGMWDGEPLRRKGDKEKISLVKDQAMTSLKDIHKGHQRLPVCIGEISCSKAWRKSGAGEWTIIGDGELGYRRQRIGERSNHKTQPTSNSITLHWIHKYVVNVITGRKQVVGWKRVLIGV